MGDRLFTLDIHASNGIRTHNSNIRAIQDLNVRGH